ncbi:MAG: GTP-binding protein [archaeon]|nr:GTP-binding protein [archaeon]
MSNDDVEFIYKVLLLGDSSVGKTCFLKRFVDGTFQEVYMSTIGLDYRLKVMTMQDNKKVKLQIWDTAGQDRFRAITKNYYKGAHGIILIYDVTCRRTFDNVRNWMAQITESASEEVSVFLVANKIDMEDERKVPEEEGKKAAEEFNLPFYEASAKSNINVDQVFNDLVKIIHDKAKKTDTEIGGVKGLTPGDNNKKKKCC